MKNERALCIIPARGGSKRIPQKNITPFLGKPLLAWSVESALKSGLFDTVMVSTDDEAVAAEAKRFGAEVPFLRDAKTSDDHATLAEVLKETLSRLKKDREPFSYGCCLLATAPFVTPARLRQAFETLRASDAGLLVPVVAFSYPVQRALLIREERLVFEQPEYLSARSQDLEPRYHDAGQFYFFRTEAFEKTGQLLCGDILPLVLPESEAQDIDTPEDLKLAEIKFRYLQAANGSLPPPETS